MFPLPPPVIPISVIAAAMTDIGITGGGKGNNMLYLSGIQSEKVLSEDIISRVVKEVEKKAAELDKKL